MATAKHFGAYGAAIGGRDYNSADISERTLQEVYLPPFYAAARAGVRFVHGRVQRHRRRADHREPRTAARRCCANAGAGRVSWCRDWGSIGELLNHGVAADRAAAGVLALDASVDMDMVGGVFADDLKEAIAKDPARLKLLDEAVLRILRVKEQLGLFDKPMQYHDVEREARELLAPEHREAARAVARQSIVLLKNEGKLLPLDPDRLQDRRGDRRARDRRALAARLVARAGQGRRSRDHPQGNHGRRAEESEDSVGAGRRSAQRRSHGYSRGGEAREERRRHGARDRRGLRPVRRSRAAAPSLELPPSQLELARSVLATGKPVVVVLANGRPLAIPELAEKAPAILETWMLGVEAGNAVADVLFGKYSPAGRLPAAFPRATGAVPFNYSANATGRPADPDLAKDTVRYHDLPITPLFPFGHGLSYSEFRYSDLAQSAQRVGPGERIDISITVENTGGVASR